MTRTIKVSKSTEKPRFWRILFFLALLFSLLTSSDGFAQGDRFTVNGQVLNYRWNTRTVNGLLVKLTQGTADNGADVIGSPQRTNYIVTYAANGYFAFSNLPAGTYRLRIYTNTIFGSIGWGHITTDPLGLSQSPAPGFDTVLNITTSDIYLHKFYAKGVMRSISGLVDSTGAATPSAIPPGLSNTQPLPGIWVRMQERYDANYYVVTKTGADGRYTIPSTTTTDSIDASGEYFVAPVISSSSQTRYTIPGYTPTTTWTTLSGNQSRGDQDVRMAWGYDSLRANITNARHNYRYQNSAISGRITFLGSALQNVKVTLTGPTLAAPLVTYTDIGGAYTFGNQPNNWAYHIVPELAGREFNPNPPGERWLSKLINNGTNQDFQAILKRYQISGSVYNGGTTLLTDNFRIQVDSTTDNGVTWIPVSGSPFGPFSGGTYSFNLNSLGWYRASAVDVTNPTTQIYLKNVKLSDYLQADVVQDFYTELGRHWIRGNVSLDPTGDPGTIQNLVIRANGNDGKSYTSATDNLGRYEFLVPDDVIYTVTPVELASAIYDPSEHNPTTKPGLALNGNLDDVNFIIKYKPKVLITGVVYINGTATGLENVRVVVEGSPGYSLTTNSSGQYSFWAAQGETYTISAYKEGYRMLLSPRTIGPIGATAPPVASFPINAELIIHTISGRITYNGSPISGFSTSNINISTGSTTPLNLVYTSSNGNYSFQVDELNSYSVTPTRNGYVFTPLKRDYSYVKMDLIDQDYTASLAKFTISGQVTVDGAALSGATVTCTGQTPVFTDASGNYSFSVDAFGNYTVSASKAGYTLLRLPNDRPGDTTFVNLAANTLQNYRAVSVNNLSIYGKVWNAGSLMPGASVKLFMRSGATWSQLGSTIVTSTSPNPYDPQLYSFINLEAHRDYRVEVTATGFTFLPNAGVPATGSYTFTDIISNQAQDFVTNAEVYSLSGKINNLAPGVYVTVKVEGSQSFVTQGVTDVNGDFTVTVPAGFTYTLTPQTDPDQGYTYQSTSDGQPFRTTGVINGATTGMNFNAIPKTYTISGNITPGNLLSTLSVSCTGATNIVITPMANPADGYNYTMDVTAHNNYTVIPSAPGYNFLPRDKAWENLVGNKTQDFTASIGTVIISGHVRLSSTAMPEVQISCTGQPALFTDINGYYSFTVPAFGTYTVTAAKVGYSFSPVSPDLGPLSVNTTQDFSANTDNNISIYGKVWHNGAMLSGASVQLYKYNKTLSVWESVGSPITTQIPSPYLPYLYRFDNLETHSNYRVQVTSTGMTFLPNTGTPAIGSATFNDVVANQEQDFVTNSNVYQVSGRIYNLSSGVFVPVKIVGSQLFTTHGITDLNGDYSISVPAGATYTITPQVNPDQGYTYTSREAGHTTETFRITPNVTGDVTGMDFNANRKTYSISGIITPTGLTGLNVTCPGATNITYNPVTGAYSMDVLSHANYTVKPILSGYTFNPIDMSWVDLVGDKTQNFFASSSLVPILQDPANGSSSISLTPTLKWLPPPAGATPVSYAVQISTSLGFGTLVGGSPFTVTHSATNPQEQAVTSSLNAGTQYFWRVSANFADGSSSDWSNIWNFTTSVAPPDPPTRIYPVDLSIRVSTRPNFGWNAAARATIYRLQIRTAPSTTAPQAVQDVEITDLTTAYQLLTALNPSTTYYWRIGSWNSSSPDTNWSTNGNPGPQAWWSFTTGMPVPVPLTPLAGTVGLPIENVMLVWQPGTPGPVPDRYHIQFATTSDFQPSTILFNQYVGTTNVNTSAYTALVASKTYYWRVSGILGVSSIIDESAWSEVMSFTTVSPTPQPISPKNNATVSLTPMLIWGPSNGADYYQIEVYSSSGYTPSTKLIIAGSDNIPSTQTLFNIPNGILINGTHYYWRVRANTGGTFSGWSNVVYASIDASFTTSALIPQLKSPSNGAIGQPVNIKFEWYPVTGATSYILQYSKDPNFGTRIERTSISATFKDETGLEMNQTYFWRVKVQTPVESPWSDVWYFSVGGSFSWDPAFIDYGEVILRKSKTKIVTLYNNGASPVIIPMLEFTDPNFSSDIPPNTIITIPPYSNKVINVIFTPLTLGQKNGKLKIYHNVASQPMNPIEIPLTGKSVSTLAMISYPEVLDFGTVAVLSGFLEKTITIKNLSTEPGDVITLNSNFFENTTSIFQVRTAFPVFISPGGSADIVVRFDPQKTGLYNNNLHIINTSINAPDAKILVKGIVVDGNLVVIPTKLDFGQTSIAQPSRVDTVYLINYGVVPVTVFSKILTQDTTSFHFVKNSGQVTLTTNQTDTVIIRFEPHDANGRKNGILDITCNDAISAKRYVPLTGIAGDNAVISVYPTEIDFGIMTVGQVKDTTVTISNDGSLDLFIRRLFIEGADKDMFLIITKVSEVILNAKSYINVTLRAIGRSTGEKGAVLNIQSDDKANPVFPILLKANVRSPIIWKSVEKIVWDTVAVKNCVDTVFKVGNIGNMTLHIEKFIIDGPNASDFKVLKQTYPFDLQPGEIKEITLTYCPKESGMRYARLVLFSNDPVTPQTSITLRSNTIVIYPELVMDTLIDFGKVTVNEISKREFEMKNISKYSDLDIDSIVISYVDHQPFSYIVPGFPIPVLRNGSFTLPLQFQPTIGDVKKYSAYMFIFYSNPSKSPARVRMIGEVIRPKADVSLQTVLKFGKVPIDSSKTQTFKISNSGDGDLIVNAIKRIGPDSAEFVVNTEMPFIVQPDHSKIVSVTFNPKKIGAKDAQLQIIWNDLTNDGIVEIWADGVPKGSGVLSIKDGEIPKEYGLLQNYPNPFNPSTRIEYSLPKSEFVSIKVYNAIGQEIETLVSETQSAGFYRVEWNPHYLSSGVYFYRINAGKFTALKKMLYVR